MAKVTTKASMILGTNYRYHLVDKGGTDIQIDATGGNIISTTTDFTASTEAAGIVNRPVVVGDELLIANPANAANEGVLVTVDTVTANNIAYTLVSGTPVDEAAGADINVTATLKQFEFLEAGDLEFIDGVDGIVWASVTVDDWDAGNLDKYDPIFTSIEPRAKSIASLNGWEPFNNDTLKSVRGTAFEIRPDANTAATKIYALPRSGNLHETTDQFFYWSDSDAELSAPTAAVTTGFIDEPILIFDSINAIDNRGLWNFRCLEPGKTHLQEQINMQFAEIYPVASNNGIDPKLADPGTGTQFVSDATVAGGGIYANVDLNIDVDSLYDGDVDGIDYSFTGFYDFDGQTNQTGHTKVHYDLRQPVNINVDGTGPVVRGDKAPPISSFSGDLLTMDSYYPLNFNPAERNNLNVIDLTPATLSWPRSSTLTIIPDALTLAGTFSLIHEDTFGTSAAVYLQNEAAADQQDITLLASNGVVVAYSTYNVDGKTPNTPIDVRLTWNRAGFAEPGNQQVTITGENQTVRISATADPSYI